MHTTEGALGLLFYYLVLVTAGTLSGLKAISKIRSNEKWLAYGFVAGISFAITLFITVGMIIG